MPHSSHRPKGLDVQPSSSSFSSSPSSSSFTSSSPFQSSHPLNHVLTRDNFRLDLMEEKAVRGGNRENYDEIDLVSECSTPGTYTPGKYLQLCDITPSDGHQDPVTLWPSADPLSPLGGSHGPHALQWDRAALLVPQDNKPVFHSSTSSSNHYKHGGFPERHHCRGSRCLSNKMVVLVAVCLIIALGALGGLVVMV